MIRLPFRTNIIVLLILLLTSHALFSQSRNVTEKNKEFSRLGKEISRLEKEIKKFSQKEKITARELESIEKQIFLYEKFISDLRSEIIRTEKSLQSLKKKSLNTKVKIKKIKNLFEKYAIWLYKFNEPTMWEMIFEPQRINEYLEMKYYFQYFTKSIQSKIDSLNAYENSLKKIKQKKIARKKYLNNLISEKEKKKSELLKAKRRKSEFLVKLRKDKRRNRKIISEKRKKQEEISALINRLLEEERLARLKREREKNVKSTKSIENEDKYFAKLNFSKMKGKLTWPVKGRLYKKFGKIYNSKLKTVSVNNGIDIKTKQGAKVKSVAPGIVSALEWLPGYGPVVIISHGEKFRSVYGFVDDFKIRKGQKVTAGQILGNVASSLEGNILHFEIWNGRNPVNPQKWLRK